MMWQDTHTHTHRTGFHGNLRSFHRSRRCFFVSELLLWERLFQTGFHLLDLKLDLYSHSPRVQVQVPGSDPGSDGTILSCKHHRVLPVQSSSCVPVPHMLLALLISLLFYNLIFVFVKRVLVWTLLLRSMAGRIRRTSLDPSSVVSWEQLKFPAHKYSPGGKGGGSDSVQRDEWWCDDDDDLSQHLHQLWPSAFCRDSSALYTKYQIIRNPENIWSWWDQVCRF